MSLHCHYTADSIPRFRWDVAVPRNPSEFVHFVARHYHLIEAMCRECTCFEADDEIAAFIRSRVDVDTNPAWKISEMKRLGVLTQSRGPWSPPSFLKAFIDALHDRHVLATPEVVQGWVDQLRRLARNLDRWLDGRNRSAQHEVDDDEARELVGQISDTIHMVSATIGENIECIGDEVAAYRATDDTGHMRQRLRRLIELYNDYLLPIIGVLEVDGPFRAVTQQISTQCARITGRDGCVPPDLIDDARRLRQNVAWLRRTVLRQADEANAELAPLCTAAVRESAIARGVNRAIEAFRQDQWQMLDLESHLPVVVDQDSSLTDDEAIEAFMQAAFEFSDQPPPIIEPNEPSTIELPWTPSALRERLLTESDIGDLLHWITTNCTSDQRAETTINLMHGLLNLDSVHASANGVVNTYRFGDLDVEAHQWSWRIAHGD